MNRFVVLLLLGVFSLITSVDTTAQGRGPIQVDLSNPNGQHGTLSFDGTNLDIDVGDFNFDGDITGPNSASGTSGKGEPTDIFWNIDGNAIYMFVFYRTSGEVQYLKFIIWGPAAADTPSGERRV